jgi:hypothetical protein
MIVMIDESLLVEICVKVSDEYLASSSCDFLGIDKNGDVFIDIYIYFFHVIVNKYLCN